MQSDLGPLPIDHRDFLLNRKVRDMPPLAFKAYVLLLCELWENGPLLFEDQPGASDIEGLSVYCGVSQTVMKNKVWPYVADLFFEVDDTVGGVGEALDHEFTNSMRKKAVKGLVARMKMADAAKRRAAANRAQSSL